MPAAQILAFANRIEVDLPAEHGLIVGQRF